MTHRIFKETWKEIQFPENITNENRLEISSFGRVRSFNRLSDGNILNGSLINGYRIIRLKLFTPRDEAIQKRLDFLQNQMMKLSMKITAMKKAGEKKAVIKEAEDLLKPLQVKLKKKFAADTKQRTIHKHFLIHRLVADYFLPKPKGSETIVGHLDYNKLNNRADNLKWMTAEENVIHQASSPYVIAEKRERRFRTTGGNTKLTVTRVMLLKKLLNEGKLVTKLAKQFKISDMQVIRIKRGENWGDVEAAK